MTCDKKGKETMLKSIIRKEILSNLLSYKFSIIIIPSAILILVSIFVMYRDYCLALDNYEILQKNEICFNYQDNHTGLPLRRHDELYSIATGGD
jgi:hypothetical protein